MKWYWILSKAFSASVEMITWFLSLLLLMCYITFIDLCCWTIPVSLGWSWLGHGKWSCWYVVGFGLPLFYWRFLHQCSLRRLAYNSPFRMSPCLVLGGVLCWQGCGGKGTHMHCTTTMENIMETHKSAIWASNTTPMDVPKGMWLKLLQKHLHTQVYFIIFLRVEVFLLGKFLEIKIIVLIICCYYNAM
jgi:hypothetical protein